MNRDSDQILERTYERLRCYHRQTQNSRKRKRKHTVQEKEIQKNRGETIKNFVICRTGAYSSFHSLNGSIYKAEACDRKKTIFAKKEKIEETYGSW